VKADGYSQVRKVLCEIAGLISERMAISWLSVIRFLKEASVKLAAT